VELNASFQWLYNRGMSMRRTLNKVFGAFVVALLLVQAVAPMRLLVFCVGDDGHRGVEFSHEVNDCGVAVAACVAETDVCCAAEEANGTPHCELGCSGSCCAPSDCNDIALSVFSVALQSKTQIADYAFVAVCSVAPLFLQADKIAPPVIDTRPSVSFLTRSSVLRI